LTTSQKVLFMAVIPEVLNRESILFKKLRAHGFSPRRVAEVTRLRGNDDFLRVHQIGSDINYGKRRKRNKF
jgi:hypothetical protein